MARIRTIKPQFFRSHNLYQTEIEANKDNNGPYLNIRLAFAGLITVADREGLFHWRPEELKLDCLPYDLVDFNLVLSALSAGPHPFIVRYETKDGPCGWIPGFKNHQRPHPEEAKSHIDNPSNEVVANFNRTALELQLDYGRSPIHARNRERILDTGITDTGDTDCSEIASDSEPPVLTFPVNGNGSIEWNLRQPFIAELQKAYPGINVDAEAQKARAWTVSNPKKRKTPAGMTRFLNSWMERAQNNGARTAGPACNNGHTKPLGCAEPKPGKYAEHRHRA